MNVVSDAKLKRNGASIFEYSTAVRLLYAITDLAAVTLAAVVGYFVVFGYGRIPPGYLVAVLLGVSLTYIIYSQAGVYDSWRGRSLFDQIRTTLLGWLSVMIVLVLLAFIFDADAQFSRRWLMYWAGGGLGMLALSRLGATLLLRQARARGWNHKRIVIVGAGEWGNEVMRRIREAANWIGIDVLCALDADDGLHGQEVHGVNIIGGYDQLPGLLERNIFDEVWICLPLSGRRQAVDDIEAIRYMLRHSTVEQRLIPDLAEARLMNKPATEIMGLPVISLNSSPMRGVNRFIKEVLDRLTAVTMLILLAPLLAAIAIAIRVNSPGPVLFKQMRHGWDGKPIRVYKFRTMCVHEESGDKYTQAVRGDARVTRVGAFLRRTSLDELPQLYNVFQGKMSLVGPRPHPIQLNRYFMEQIDSYMQRHKVKPGITGWAQVNGLRGPTDTLEKMERRIEYDLYYIENWSLWFDLRIMLMTLYYGFVNENAY